MDSWAFNSVAEASRASFLDSRQRHLPFVCQLITLRLLKSHQLLLAAVLVHDIPWKKSGVRCASRLVDELLSCGLLASTNRPCSTRHSLQHCVCSLEVWTKSSEPFQPIDLLTADSPDLFRICCNVTHCGQRGPMLSGKLGSACHAKLGNLSKVLQRNPAFHIV